LAGFVPILADFVPLGDKTEVFSAKRPAWTRQSNLPG
jgi:hypothetical protein